MPYLFLLAALASPAFEDLEIHDERILAVSGDAVQIDKRLKLAECPDDPITVHRQAVWWSCVARRWAGDCTSL